MYIWETQLSASQEGNCHQNLTLVAPWSWVSSLQNLERMFLLFKPLSLWYFAMVTQADKYNWYLCLCLYRYLFTSIPNLYLLLLISKETTHMFLSVLQIPIQNFFLPSLFYICNFNLQWWNPLLSSIYLITCSPHCV